MEEYVEYQNNLATKGDELPNELDYDRFKDALEKAKSYLSPRQREIFELNKEYGISIFEIAEKLFITEQVVRFPKVESITLDKRASNCSIIENIPPKGVIFSDFICTLAMSDEDL